MSDEIIGKQMRLLVSLLLMLMLASAHVEAQRGGQPAPQPPASPRASAPIDVTGYWVSIVSEDWRWRMVTPPKGDFIDVPLNAEGRRVTASYDPDKDEASGEQCKAYGAPGVMRMPTRLHVTWQDDNTLKIETDTGAQIRLLHFGTAPPPAGTERSWQGYSVATWEVPGPQSRTDSLNSLFRAGPAPPPVPGGSLKVVTTMLRAGYLRTNGVPFSENAVLTEYFDRHTDLGVDYITHARIIDDLKYLNETYIVTSHFKRESDASKWNPKPCVTARPFE